MPRPKISAKTPAAHAATWSRTIRLFAASEAGSQTMRAAGGTKERERSRTGADNTSVCRRYTSSRLVWENPNNRGGNYRRVRCDVRRSDRCPGCPVPRMCSFLGHPVQKCPNGGYAPRPTRPRGQTQPVGGRAARTYQRWRQPDRPGGLLPRPPSASGTPELTGNARAPFPGLSSRVSGPRTAGC